jgi:HSP20 family molecular chaperone IbpA
MTSYFAWHDTYAFSMDMSETDDGYKMKVEMPGIRKENVNVQVDRGVLTVSGEEKTEKEDRDAYVSNSRT